MSCASNQMRQLQSSPSKEHGVVLKRLLLHRSELQETTLGPEEDGRTGTMTELRCTNLICNEWCMHRPWVATCTK